MLTTNSHVRRLEFEASSSKDLICKIDSHDLYVPPRGGVAGQKFRLKSGLLFNFAHHSSY